MRVVHLFDDHYDDISPMRFAELYDCVEQTPEHEHEIILLGHAQMQHWANEFPVFPVDYIPHWKPVQLTDLRLLRLRQSRRKPDTVHCWSLGALGVASRLYQNTPIIYQPDSPIKKPQADRDIKRYINRIGHLHFILPNQTFAQQFQHRYPGRVVVVHTPTPRFTAIHTRKTIRQRWEIGPETAVFSVIADPVNHGSTLIGGWLLALLKQAGMDAKLMMPPEMDPNRRTITALEGMGLDNVLIRDDDAIYPWKTLPGVDAVVMLGGLTETVQEDASIEVVDNTAYGVGPVGSLALRLKLPVVAEATDCYKETLVESERCRLVKPASPRLLANALTQMLSLNLLDSVATETEHDQAAPFNAIYRRIQGLQRASG